MRLEAFKGLFHLQENVRDSKIFLIFLDILYLQSFQQNYINILGLRMFFIGHIQNTDKLSTFLKEKEKKFMKRPKLGVLA